MCPYALILPHFSTSSLCHPFLRNVLEVFIMAEEGSGEWAKSEGIFKRYALDPFQSSCSTYVAHKDPVRGTANISIHAKSLPLGALNVFTEMEEIENSVRIISSKTHVYTKIKLA